MKFQSTLPFGSRTVKKIQEKLVASSMDEEYLPIDGLPGLKKPTQALIFGPDFAGIHEERITSVQALSGTGGLRVAAEFVKTQIPQCEEAYVSQPTWSNHPGIFSTAGFRVKEYSYWNAVSFPMKSYLYRITSTISVTVVPVKKKLFTESYPTHTSVILMRLTSILEVLLLSNLLYGTFC